MSAYKFELTPNQIKKYEEWRKTLPKDTKAPSVEQQHATNNLKHISIYIMMLNTGWPNHSMTWWKSFTSSGQKDYARSICGRSDIHLRGERTTSSGFDFRVCSDTHSITGRR